MSGAVSAADVEMFRDVTGGSLDAAKKYLQASKGDVEQAIVSFLESGESPAVDGDGSMILKGPMEVAENEDICVKVMTLSGEELDYRLNSTECVHALKTHITQAWGVPDLCQKLIVDGAPVDDWELLKHIKPSNDTTLLVTLIVSAEEALAKLHPALCGETSARLEALRTLCRLNLSGVCLDGQTCRIIAAFLNMRDDWEVERLAIDVLGKAAAMDDECAIDALLKVVRSVAHPFCHNAMQALGRIVSPGHRAACEVLFAKAMDRNKKSRLASLDTLLLLAPRGDDNAIDLATGLLQGKDADTCKAALKLLEAVAGETHAKKVQEQLSMV